jgi:hypothetical protein
VIKTIKLKDAVGMKLAHDITEIRPGEFKGAAFHKGHTVCNEDLCRLQKLGKNHLYLIDLEDDEIHENEAAAIMAEALAGKGVVWKNEPREGKIGLKADRDGLLIVNVSALAAFNMIEEVMCATLHNHTMVKAGELVAATRDSPGHETGAHRTGRRHRRAKRRCGFRTSPTEGKSRPDHHRK